MLSLKKKKDFFKNLMPFLCPVAEFAELVSELQEVNDWIPFGLCLGIKVWKLEAIETEYSKLGRRRTQMLVEWQKNVTPTWSAVVQALVQIGMRHLAFEIAQKHGRLSNVVYNPIS